VKYQIYTTADMAKLFLRVTALTREYAALK
jgi:hypothetical protein